MIPNPFNLPLDVSAQNILDPAGKQIIALLPVSNPVNYMTVRNSATGVAVRLLAQGTDTDIDLRLDAKGAGKVRVGATAEVLTTASTADTDATARVGVALEGVPVGSRRQINFLTGSNVTFDITDDAGNERVDVEISATGGGGGGLGQADVLIRMAYGGF